MDKVEIVIALLSILAFAGALGTACATRAWASRLGREAEELSRARGEAEASRRELEALSGKADGGRGPGCRRSCMAFSECALLVVYECVAKAAIRGMHSCRVPLGWITPEVRRSLEYMGFGIIPGGPEGDAVGWSDEFLSDAGAARLRSELESDRALAYRLAVSQRDMDPEASRILEENLWDMVGDDKREG